MAELFKNIYNTVFFDVLTTALNRAVPRFDKTVFLTHIYDATWEERELKQRMRHLSNVLHIHLPGDFNQKVETILRIIARLQKDGHKEDSIEYMFFPDFIEVYGLEHYDVSIQAFEIITQFTSCEFAVRPFIIKYEDRMVKQMRLWARHEHPSVRRLVSEGSRPRLPWAVAIPAFKKDPAPIMPILATLKNDTSSSVRRSVANNLNDISKDNPITVIEVVKNWQGKNKNTDLLLKHASRSLLKQGGSDIMSLFGFGSVEKIKIKDFQIHTPCVKIGEHLEFTFTLVNTDTQTAKLRLEYGVYYQKANASLSRKVYKISEKSYGGTSKTHIARKQSFKVITTRKLHPGKHHLALILNGAEMQKLDFVLMHS